MQTMHIGKIRKFHEYVLGGAREARHTDEWDNVYGGEQDRREAPGGGNAKFACGAH